MGASEWADRLRRNGFAVEEALGSGMEAAAFTLGPDSVVKVWFDRTAADLAPLVSFYAELLDAGLPFATPDVREVSSLAGRAVTVERRLPGGTLHDALASGAIGPPTAQSAALTVITALAEVAAGPAAAALPVLGEAPPWSPNAPTWGDALAAVLRRRLDRYGAGLRAAVRDLDAKVAGVLRLLAELPPAPRGLVHGDLCQPNVLVDDTGRVTALLDWGFLTTKGDPAFDAATFAGFFDMYGPDARRWDDTLTALFCDRLGHRRDRLLLYRAYYALIGAHAYDPAGADGHFAWCAATLDRPDVTALLVG
ncbi:phosphotransferase [Actinocatenispora rupis]|uniref:Aminoglycoside phosphotransferase domain-containing protein n=1 Tax=Actinocatenispora rupis TaxID=519421 RepID=A0A8J3NEW5_9ACTN|nr:phosphotransferase [Actinocatenispora rupis]GID14542.1 hypothetical protein Aru02nite_54310 [Actinocatenispora rupis]